MTFEVGDIVRQGVDPQSRLDGAVSPNRGTGDAASAAVELLIGPSIPTTVAVDAVAAAGAYATTRPKVNDSSFAASDSRTSHTATPVVPDMLTGATWTCV